MHIKIRGKEKKKKYEANAGIELQRKSKRTSFGGMKSEIDR